MDPIVFREMWARLSLVVSVIKTGDLQNFRNTYAKEGGDYPADKELILQVLDKFLSAAPEVHEICRRASVEREMMFNAPKN